MTNNKQKIVVFSGAGISVESGLGTFRGAQGLWENYKIEDVATPQAWDKNPELVQEFYNLRRKACLEASPNEGHFALARLEQNYDVSIVTQNIDNLHERAGSSKIIHLHGEITKSRSTKDPSLVYDIQGHTLRMGDKCQLGAQLRPHIVWFGESVPMMTVAEIEVATADILIVVGTSLQVYPAAGLVYAARSNTAIYLVDPNKIEISASNVIVIAQNASTGLVKLEQLLLR